MTRRPIDPTRTHRAKARTLALRTLRQRKLVTGTTSLIQRLIPGSSLAVPPFKPLVFWREDSLTQVWLAEGVVRRG